MSTVNAWVHTLKYEAQDIISVELRPMPGETLPTFQAGAHIDLHLPSGLVRSYSLANDSGERHRYLLGILKDKASRGGSRAVHEQLRVGMSLPIGTPRNNFPLHEDADHSVLIAGGIGITPILSMAQRLQALGRSFEVVYLARSRAAAAFSETLHALACPVHWHFDNEAGGPPNLKVLLAQRSPKGNSHYYACGPAVMLDAFESACTELAYANAHIERFAAVEVKAAEDARQKFSVELRKSQKTFEVNADTSLHKQLLALKVNVPFSCEEGICGSCETRVLEGTPDHRDMVLSASEQASNQVMMVCVSGCKTERLVLDL
jgi:ferredoxin-NADP reductase